MGGAELRSVWPLGGSADPRSRDGAELRDPGDGRCRAGSGAQPPGQDPSSQTLPHGHLCSSGAPLFRAHTGGCGSLALLLPDRQRDGAGLQLWVGRGCGVTFCSLGSHGRGWLLPRQVRVWGGQAVASLRMQQCPPSCHRHRHWNRQPSPRGALGTWRWGFAVTRAVSIPENRPTAAPELCCRSCDLAPSAKGAGGRREQPDGHQDTRAGLCLCQWALAFGALSRIALSWMM